MTDDITMEEAVRLADNTRQCLKNDGYCIWQCANLDDDRILVINNSFDILKLPEKVVALDLPVYTLQEIESLYDCNEWSLTMIHAAKKQDRDIKVTPVS